MTVSADSPTRTFLEMLFPELDKATLIELRGFKPGTRGEPPLRDWYQSIDEVLAVCEERRDELDIYFGVAARRRRGGKKTDLCSTMALWADLDTAESTRNLGLFPHPPSAIIASGTQGHLQAYWLLREPHPLEEEADRHYFEERNKGLAEHLGADAAWDSTRIFRLPGTLNHKHGEHRPVELKSFQPERCYNLSDFDLWAAPVEDVAPVTFGSAADAEVAMAEAEAGGLRERTAKLITEGHTAGSDRSSQDFGAVCDLIRVGRSDDEIRAIFTAFPIGEKYQEEGDHYLARTLGRARADVAKNGQKVPAPTAVVVPTGASGNGTQPNKEQSGWPRTDVGNAELFAHLCADRLRYDHQRERWLLWDGQRWKADPDAEVYRLAIEATRTRYRNAGKIDDLKERAEEASWAIKGEKRAAIEAMLALGKVQLGIADAGDNWDADPWLLNVKNGTLELRTGELREHRQADRITKLVPTDYDPDAKCPTWDAFLDRILGDRPELVEYLQRLVGYSMTGEVIEQIIILLIGLGSNGKSTLEEALLDLFADYATMAAPGLLLTSRNERHPTELADLYGKRFVMSMEVGEGKRLAETLVKQLSGSDTIKARRMNEDFWSFTPTHQLWLAANYKPVIKGTDLAIWRRIRLVPFDVVIPPAERNKKLPAQLRTELPGILAWAVRGCLAWQKDGLEPPEAVTVATAAYQEESDVLADFLSERCGVGDGSTIQASALYKAYTAWAECEGLRPRDVLSSTMFGRRMTDRFHKEHKRQGWVYFGIGLPATNVTSSVTSSESDHPVSPLKGPVTPRVETNLQNQSNPSPSLENPAPDDEHCQDCEAELSYYDPEGTAYCAKHGPGVPS